MSILRTLLAAAIIFSNLGLSTNVAPNDPTQHGLTIFYKMNPTEAQINSFSNGNFDSAPPSVYECGPDPDYPFHPPSFGCANPALAQNTTTPQQIYEYGTPDPHCLSMGIAFEHLQWATWTHACWQHPRPAIDTPTGHAEAAFQSSALAFRALVLYQHNKHFLTLNSRIADLRLSADAEIEVMRAALDKSTREIDARYDAEIDKLRDADADRRRRRDLRARDYDGVNQEREQKKDALRREADDAIRNRELTFWKDSWVHRQKTVEIDHLVGEYFERWMGGRTQGGWDWAGMGEPDPAFPEYFVVP